MIKKIHFNQYRKLKDLDIEFTKNINIISGTNGTCKTSILHLCSNAFQAPKKDDIQNDSVLTTLNTINMLTNPKIETLTKGDKKYNNPAPNFDGPLFNITYFDNINLDFRRHNTDSELSKHKRYRIILKYPKGKKMSLKTLKNLNIPKDVRVVNVRLTTPLEVCLERNALREGRERVSDEVIKNAYSIFLNSGKIDWVRRRINDTWEVSI